MLINNQMNSHVGMYSTEAILYNKSVQLYITVSANFVGNLYYHNLSSIVQMITQQL